MTGTVDPPDLGVLHCACFCLIRPEQGAILCGFLHINCAHGRVGMLLPLGAAYAVFRLLS